MDRKATSNAAAQYLRMSTEMQHYSLGNQAALIAAYAAAEGLEIVATYEDAGKSGVTAAKRPALQSLLRDALSGSAPFTTLLVLDVSRWGRFQDPDEAAHYEFICRSSGIDVRYCAEAFEPGPSGAIMKQLKRVMAGEYSRELSNKTRFGQCRQAGRGFVIGGVAPYGFRRQAIGADGSPGKILDIGERRARVTDNVRWVVGSPNEIEQIQQIFDLYVRRGLSDAAIARFLNTEGKAWSDGTEWQRHRVKNVLQCELVIGNYVYGRRSQSLNKSVRTPESQWRRTRMVEPIIKPARFQAAQDRRKGMGSRQYSEGRLLADLRRILRRRKCLTAELIQTDEQAASIATYAARFGSLTEAYRRVEYDPTQKRVLKGGDGRRKTEEEVLADLRAIYQQNGTITGRIIRNESRLPSLDYFVWHFGSLSNTYTAAGIVVVGAKRRAPKLTGVGSRLTDRETLVVQALRTRGRISVTETADLLGSGWTVAKSTLDRLESAGFVVRGSGKSRESDKKYRLRVAV